MKRIIIAVAVLIMSAVAYAEPKCEGAAAAFGSNPFGMSIEQLDKYNSCLNVSYAEAVKAAQNTNNNGARGNLEFDAFACATLSKQFDNASLSVSDIDALRNCVATLAGLRKDDKRIQKNLKAYDRLYGVDFTDK